MKKPVWFSGEAQEWSNVEKITDLNDKLKQNQDKTHKNSMVNYGGFKRVFLWTAGTVVGVGVVALKALTFFPLVVIAGIGAGLFIESRLEKASFYHYRRKSQNLSVEKDEAVADLAQKIGLKRLNEMCSELTDSAKKLQENGFKKEADDVNGVNKVLQEARRRAEIENFIHGSTGKTVESILNKQVEPEKEVDQQIVESAPEKDPNDSMPKPKTLREKMEALGSIAADGLAALALANGIVEDEKNEGQEEKKEAAFFISSRLPKLVEAYEAVPVKERDIEDSTLGCTPRESMARGCGAALNRMMELRSSISSRSKLRMEQEARVMEETVTQVKIGKMR